MVELGEIYLMREPITTYPKSFIFNLIRVDFIYFCIRLSSRVNYYYLMVLLIDLH